METSRALLNDLAHRVEAEYSARTPKSAALYENATDVMPGGDTRTVTYFEPHPLFIESGKGCCLIDVDNNEYLDFMNNYSALIHGHAHPAIVEAVSQQLRKGTCFASPIELQTRLAQILCTRLPGVERIRFCNSGTEATLIAIRTAKAFTGRNKILKMEGGYHGSHDLAQISVKPRLIEAGPANAPNAVPDTPGLFRGVISDVLVAPFNDIAATSKIIDLNRDDLAAVIVEPVLGSPGLIPAQPPFLRFLREACQSCGAILIFDEVVTFRLAFGGAQELYHVTPDLTTLGKIIGGGFPVGAFGGRADIMELLNPRKGKLSHSGTFNGNAITMAAGLACLELLTADEIQRINQLGDTLKGLLAAALASASVPGQITGTGSLINVHFTDRKVIDYRTSALSETTDILRLLHLSLLNQGIFIAPRGEFCISTPMTQKEIESAAEAFRSALDLASTYFDSLVTSNRHRSLVQRS